LAPGESSAARAYFFQFGPLGFRFATYQQSVSQHNPLPMGIGPSRKNAAPSSSNEKPYLQQPFGRVLTFGRFPVPQRREK